MEEPSIEPELLRPPPRQLRRRRSQGYGTLAGQVATVVFLAFSLFMCLWLADVILVRMRGPVVEGRIVGRHIANADSKPVYVLAYHYYFREHEYDARDEVERSLYVRLPVGSTASVQISTLWPGLDSVLRMRGHRVWVQVMLQGFVTAVVVAAILSLMGFNLVLPLRQRRLVVMGTPVLGRVTNKTKHLGGRLFWYVHYKYQPIAAASQLIENHERKGAPSRRHFTGKQSVLPADWKTTSVGDSYTILYDPQRPASSVIYQFGDHEAV